MRFPLRLTAEITKAKWREMLGGGAADPFVLRVLAPVADVNEDVSSPQVDEAVLAQLQARTSPVVWFGGNEPLQYSGMGHLARRVIDCRRTVFVETDGALLRRCIFSFRPAPQLFLAVQLDGLESSHDRRAGHAGLYRAAMEGIRAARLSGFMICLVTRIYEDTDLHEVEELRTTMASLDLDGWVIMAALQGAAAPALEKKLLAARALAGSGWGNFSRLVELTEWPPLPQSASIEGASVPGESREEACEEGVRVP
jgi:sulfatase maturation enzyme AslB (radical SAM superfamily)